MGRKTRQKAPPKPRQKPHQKQNQRPFAIPLPERYRYYPGTFYGAPASGIVGSGYAPGTFYRAPAPGIVGSGYAPGTFYQVPAQGIVGSGYAPGTSYQVQVPGIVGSRYAPGTSYQVPVPGIVGSGYAPGTSYQVPAQGIVGGQSLLLPRRVIKTEPPDFYDSIPSYPNSVQGENGVTIFKMNNCIFQEWPITIEMEEDQQEFINETLKK